MSAELALRGGAHDAEGRISEMSRRVVGRPPTPAEAKVLATLLATYVGEYDARLDDAESLLGVGESAWDGQVDPRELAAYTGLASVLLNLDEAITKQ